MDEDVARVISELRERVMRMEINLQNAMKNQAETNAETTRHVRELRAENKESDRKITRILTAGALLMPVLLVLLNYFARKIN